MLLCSYAEFGVADLSLYREYVRAHLLGFACVCVDGGGRVGGRLDGLVAGEGCRDVVAVLDRCVGAVELLFASAASVGESVGGGGGRLGSGVGAECDACGGSAQVGAGGPGPVGSGVAGGGGAALGGGATGVAGGVGVCESGVSVGAGDSVTVSAGVRARRRRRKRAAAAVRAVSADESGVPEWRRNAPVAAVHKGAFAECSEGLQRDLRETRAERLIAENKAAVVRADVERRRLECSVKTQVLEREFEVKRLKVDAERAQLVKRRVESLPAGFVETVVSDGLSEVIAVPSLTAGDSVSPDSSVSVAMVHRMEDTIRRLTAELAAGREELKKEKATLAAMRKADCVRPFSVSAPRRECYGGSEGFSRWDL